MDADGTGAVNITNTSSQFEALAQWHPGTNRLLFSGGTLDGGINLWTMNPDGSGRVQVTNDGWDEYYGAWSWNGDRIAYHGLWNGNWEVIAMNADGTNQVNLTNFPSQPDQAPFFDPSGNVYFHSTRNGIYGTYRMGPNGQDVTLIRAGFIGDRIELQSVPEPATTCLMATAAIAYIRRRKRAVPQHKRQDQA